MASKKTEILLRVILFLEIATLCYFNFFHMQDILDCDLAKLMRHTIEMAHCRSLFVPEWNYLTTGEMDCASLLAIPFYVLTGNIYLSFAISNLLNIAMWIGILHVLCNLAELDRIHQLLFFMFLFTVYDIGMLEYANMLFIGGGQYVYKALLPLLFVTLLYLPDHPHKKRTTGILCFLFFSLLLISGISSGIYVFICGIFPAMICFIILCLGTDSCKIRLQQLVFCIVTIFTTLLGTWICKAKDINPNSSSMTLRPFDHAFYGFEETVNSLIVLFHGRNGSGIELVGYEGVAILLNWLIVSILGYGALRALYYMLHRRIFKPEGDPVVAEQIEFTLAGIFIGNFLILYLTMDTPRYHLIGAIPLMICAVMEYQREQLQIKKGLSIILLFTMAFTVLAFCGYNFFFKSKAYFDKQGGYAQSTNYSSDYMKEMKEVLERNDVKTCFFVQNESLSGGPIAECMRLYDQEHIYEEYDLKKQAVVNYDFYISEMDRSAYSDRNIIMVLPEDYDLLPEHIRGSYHELDAVHGYRVLLSDSNPMDGIYGPMNGRTAVDLPSNPAYQVEGSLDGNGYLICGTEGVVLSSPEMELNPETTKVVINYWSEQDAMLEVFFQGDLQESVVIPVLKDTVEVPILHEGNYSFQVRNGNETTTMIKTITFVKQ